MQHLIKKQELLLRISSGLEPFGVQHAASSFYRNKLLSVLEKVFDECSTNEEVILIDRLVIDLGRIAEKSLRGDGSGDELYAAIKKEFLRVLKGERPEAGLVRADLRENALSQWWYYMEKGRLPWNITDPGREWYQQVLEMLSVDYNSVTRLRQALESQAAFLQRVSHQHPDEFLETLTGILTGARQPSLTRQVEAIGVLSQWLEQTFHDMTSIIGSQPGPAEKRAETIRALRRWMEAHSSFLMLLKPERKAAVWRILLREAARRPEKLRTSSPEWVLLREFLRPEEGLIRRLLQESGLRLPEIGVPGDGSGGRKAVREPGEAWEADEPGEPEAKSSAVETRDEKEEGSIGQTSKDTGAPAPANETESSAATQPAAEKKAVTPEKARVVQPDEALDEAGLFGRHAGLILLHPFLPAYFHRCGLWDNGVFLGPQARQQAVFLLHFLATGEKEAPEYELLFPKILCGYGLEEPLPARTEIPDSAREEGEALLQNILLQWDKLKRTSIGGLREGFLQRTGKLIRRNDRTRLMLEISSIDALLDFLPWGLSIVKLPWLKDIIYVEWR
ncbi:contractile injection system tape measure protein [Puia sp.]|uniref:contractile injection system tape measure protein n=1 Tax=Puia sp. TaxID=2045100 RepID=UPI002F3FBE01